VDLRELIEPAHTAVVTQEIQRGILEPGSALPDLADAVSRVGLLDNVAQLLSAARQVGARVVHCTTERRADGLFANRNARIFQYMARKDNNLVSGSRAAELCPEIGALPEELRLPRVHGLSPFQGTELDFALRNEGVTTIIGVGVSVNVAIQNFAFDAVNSSYQMVIPRDGVAGFPAEYVEAVFANTLGAVATLCTTDDILAAWKR
jgi:nicotinamidase-related amidase